jgi:hypothetical protein
MTTLANSRRGHWPSEALADLKDEPMRHLSLTIFATLLLLTACSHNLIALTGTKDAEVLYLSDDGRWVPPDSLSWSDRCWYREIRFDTDGDGKWNYLYAEIYDDVAGWTWIPSSARVNPEEEPEVARSKKYLVRERDVPPRGPTLDDFGY